MEYFINSQHLKLNVNYTCLVIFQFTIEICIKTKLFLTKVEMTTLEICPQFGNLTEI